MTRMSDFSRDVTWTPEEGSPLAALRRLDERREGQRAVRRWNRRRRYHYHGSACRHAEHMAKAVPQAVVTVDAYDGLPDEAQCLTCFRSRTAQNKKPPSTGISKC